ncbi:MAG: N-6 DNA methylase [Gemella haemolysans]|uniref:N-6 DNA methylase n=1 Tax=uncultured Haemophilus sp. TaxID=237779 RepID=UPI002805BBA8|nr:N-6 DNA methylase [uncultured Haemophilus sp.]MBS6187855.1 N-6 DNA methylase [Haemophilus parainfluenzae]MDU6706747.1 N-6 DNA methylase [Haemophilus parainfluenzae]MDU8070158.1 N-6 DNA methylase [Gemella haemolysans]
MDNRIEQYTEDLVKKEMGFTIGDNEFGFVYPQGNVFDIANIMVALREAGGKPKECELSELNINTNNKKNAEPEFIIRFNDDHDTICVIECKKSIKKHKTDNLNRPNDYAVDGVLYYSKFLKNYYNVIAVAVSGTVKDKFFSDVYFWSKNQEKPILQEKFKDILLSPKNYLDSFNGKKISRSYSLEEIKETAINFHDKLRLKGIGELEKPILIAGILIALEDESVVNDYQNITSYSSLRNILEEGIETVLNKNDVKVDNKTYIINTFKAICNNPKLKSMDLAIDGSLKWYLKELELKIKPMMNNADYSLDALGVFYHEFIKYSGGDGKGLGIVLTPQHLTDFMCDLANITSKSKVIDICCGSASFLVTAMHKMFKEAISKDELNTIREKQLYGIEAKQELHALAIANMIIRKDGKSNIIYGDCFSDTTIKELKNRCNGELDIALLNPPYSQKDHEELEFVEQALSLLKDNGIAVVVVPMSCAIGTKFKQTRERLFNKNTLKAVFSMPDDIFYPTGTNVCVMVWIKGVKHNENIKTFFGYCKEDGFVKKKNLGRVDAFNNWNKIKREWLRLYNDSEVKDGLSAKKAVKHTDEWLAEAYMKTDYSKLEVGDFKKSISNYLSYLIKFNLSSLKDINKFNKINTNLNVDEWIEFSLIDYFNMDSGKYISKDNYNNGDTPYISASDTSNAVMDLIDIPAMFRGNKITIGKIGIASYYQPYDFCATSDVTVLSPKENTPLNKYIALFVTTILNKERFKWSYGRQIRLGDCKELVIKLPSKNNKPDWDYMEKFIKSLPYSEYI